LLPDRFERTPMVSSPGYVDALISILQAHAVDVLLPGIDSEIMVLSSARDRLANIGTRVVLAPADLVVAADDKLLTAAFLSERGIAVPATCDASAPTNIGFPLIAKPRSGHGSQGITLLADAGALQAFLATRPVGYCLQSFVDGPEFTVGFLYDSNGIMRDAVAMERILQNGRTVRGRVVDCPEMQRFMRDFGASVPGRGAVNAQLRWDPRRGAMVFEINARLSGSTDMRIAAGCNDPLRLARHFGRGTPIAAATPIKAVIHRSGNRVQVEAC